jgi:hypothetical protein
MDFFEITSALINPIESTKHYFRSVELVCLSSSYSIVLVCQTGHSRHEKLIP